MSTRKGATLIEVIVVIAILGALVGLLLGAILKVRMTAAGLQDKNQLRQIVLAAHNYASACEGKFPSATFAAEPYFLQAILPQLEVNGAVAYSDPPRLLNLTIFFRYTYLRAITRL